MVKEQEAEGVYKWAVLSSGVPEGPVLVSVLFNWFINSWCEQ